MSTQYVSASPSTAGMLKRTRLLDALDAAFCRISLLSAPSGYGKTTLAAQLASSFESVEWLNCAGERPDSALVATCAMRLSGCKFAGPPLTLEDVVPALATCAADPGNLAKLLVIDDAEFGPDVASELLLLCRLLAQSGISVLVSTRTDCASIVGTMHDVCILGPEQLKLDRDEALTLAGSVVRSGLPEVRVDSMWRDTQGHVALFAVMSHAARHDLAVGGQEGRVAAWIDRIVQTQFGFSERQALALVGILQWGSAADLALAGVPDAIEVLALCTRSLPLVRLSSGDGRGAASQLRFVAHDTVCEYVLQRRSVWSDLGPDLARRALPILVERGDLVRASEVVGLLAEREREDFVASSGIACISAGGATSLLKCIESLPVSSMMASPRLMLTWSEALLETGNYSDAYAKARAARVLAEHQGDVAASVHSLANALSALRLSNRWMESNDLLSEAEALVEQIGSEGDIFQLQRSAGSTMLLMGLYTEAERMLSVAREGATHAGATAVVIEADNVLALIPCLRGGDFVTTLKSLSRLVSNSSVRTSHGIDCRGNMVVGLIETGRVARARNLLQPVLAVACDAARSSFLPSQAIILMADGEDQAALEVAQTAVTLALEGGSSAVAAQDRVYQAMLMRAAGRLDDSLIAAERAYEALSDCASPDFRRLSVLEIAASMLALGDVAAATAWLEPQLNEGFGENEHHRYRALMIRAEIARRQGDTPRAIEILGSGAEHLLSENSNLQAALYARAFPHLLGLIAASVGAAEVPMHMLRLIPAEVGEGILQAAKETLEASEWEVLGQRLLGEQQFAEFVAREGSPLCRVKLFGGLEVTVGERRVREKDWRKRKARLLFAILVLERGRQLSREQLLAHVWPDLPEDRAKNNFYVAWSNMKSALSTGQGAPFLFAENTGGLCNIVRDAVRSDVDEFEEFLVAGKDCEARGDVPGAIAAYQQLATIYRGELLPGDLYDDWFMPMRERYRSDFIAVMLRLVDLLLEADDPCEAAVYARRALGVDPYREDLYQALIKCQIVAGQRSAAIETFITCKTQIAEQLGLDPSPETTALYQEILCMEDKPRYDDLGLSGGRY